MRIILNRLAWLLSLEAFAPAHQAQAQPAREMGGVVTAEVDRTSREAVRGVTTSPDRRSESVLATARIAALETSPAESHTLARARGAPTDVGTPVMDDPAPQPSGGWSTFLKSLLIIVREGFEAILIIGAVATFLIKTGNRRHLRSIWLGSAAALAASAVTAVVLQTVLSAMPASQEIIEGITMLLAVVVLFSVSYWLISKVEAAKWQQFIRQKVNTALQHGGGMALALVAFVAVYREGAETVLFYQALFASGSGIALPITLGMIVGTVLLAVIFTLVYRFGVRIPLRPFFAVTSVMLYYLAFVFAGKGIHELQEGGVLPLTPVAGVPRIGALGVYPTAETLLAQGLLLALFAFALAKTFWPTRTAAQSGSPAAPATVGDDLAIRVAQLQEVTAQLETRLELLERSVADGRMAAAAPQGR